MTTSLVTELPTSAYPRGNSFSLTASEYAERLSVTVQTNDTGPRFSTFKKRGDPCLEDRKKKQDEGQLPRQSGGSQVGTGDPLAGLTCGVQCWRTRELRRSHVIFSIVFCTWVRDSLSIPCWRWYGCCQSYCGLEGDSCPLTGEARFRPWFWQTSTLLQSPWGWHLILCCWLCTLTSWWRGAWTKKTGGTEFCRFLATQIL